MRGVIPILPETAASQDIHIASLVLQVRPKKRDRIEEQINSMANCTCYSDKADTAEPASGLSADKRDSVLVVVMEVLDQGDINRVINDLNTLDGVLNVNLVYHYADSAESMTDELEVSQ